MAHREKRGLTSGVFLVFTLLFCGLFAVLVALLALFHAENNMDSFAEPVLEMSDGWTLTNSAGESSEVSLPQTLPYGSDGVYTLTNTLPDVGGRLVSPALRFYSNYVDIDISIDGETLCSFPQAPAPFSGATGNTYHFVRLPVDYAGRTVSVTLRGQLGSDITYLVDPPLIGSKATMLKAAVTTSLPALMLSGCMAVTAVGLAGLFLTFRRKLSLNNATVFTALFALLFAIYVYCETVFAQLITPNGYLLCFCTLTLLALMPIPPIGIFMEAMSDRFKPVARGLMALCSLNLVVQTVLNLTGVRSVRVMLPATHAMMIASIVLMALCLFFSNRAEKPDARRALLSAIPMTVGGIADIVLLNLGRPSPNNSLWFTLGVTAFIVIQFCGFVRTYFELYRSSLETTLLRDMAYRDELTGIGNRNAYERRLKELSAGPLTERLCCIILDINDLKMINDLLGHQAGDAAIKEVGGLLREITPEGSSCFRTGGDEFVVLLEDCAEADAAARADRLVQDAALRGGQLDIPLSLAVGCGCYREEDGNLIDFIRRVDSLMYSCKRGLKRSPGYPFPCGDKA